MHFVEARALFSILADVDKYVKDIHFVEARARLNVLEKLFCTKRHNALATADFPAVAR